jgi:hypothetical protein
MFLDQSVCERPEGVESTPARPKHVLPRIVENKTEGGISPLATFTGVMCSGTGPVPYLERDRGELLALRSPRIDTPNLSFLAQTHKLSPR